MAEAISKPVAAQVCLECGVAVPTGTRHCWLCGHSVVLPRRSGRGPARYDARSVFRFQLHSMFLTIGLVALCLAIARHWPHFAIALVVPLATAYLRTLQIALDYAAVGRPLRSRGKIVWYVRSLGVAFVILCGASAALIVSIGVGAGLGLAAWQWREEPMYIPVGFATGTSLGVFGALAIAAWTGQRLWPGPSVRREMAE